MNHLPPTIPIPSLLPSSAWPLFSLLRPCLVALCLILAACVERAAAQPSVMAAEADSFLRSLPAGLQARQAEAVRRATRGDLSDLQAVRASRNGGIELPPGVVARAVGDTYRLYRPEGCENATLPVLIYLHGGGWCFGSLNSCAHFCAELARTAGVAVLAVDYPLAPEHPYPAALQACTDAVVFVAGHAAELCLRSDAISLGGDSSGGNLALATALHLVLARQMLDRQPPGPDTGSVPRLRSLVLFYPVTKAWADGSASWQRHAEGYGLDASLMEAFNAAYADSATARLPLVSPGTAPDALLAQLPPVLLVNAGRDILLAQGEELAARLSDLGVDVRHEVLAGAVHLFITVPGQPAAFSASVTLAADFLTSPPPSANQQTP